jgi:hypothetical protein
MIKKLKERLCRFRDVYAAEGLHQATKAAAKHSINELKVTPTILIHSLLANELNVYNVEWDLLIILDTCRPDALRKVSSEFPFIQQVDSKWSVGSTSPEWMYNTFTQSFSDDISNTSLITSNVYAWGLFKNNFERIPSRNFTDSVSDENIESSIKKLKKYAVTSPVNSDLFDKVELVSENSKRYSPIKYPSPRRVTDHVIEQDRDNNPPERIIAHYMPPHTPYIARSIDGDIQFSEEARKFCVEAYIDNLRWALEEVSLLLENVDRKSVVITADHGENFGSWLTNNNHGVGMILPAVRQVPWAETSASDDHTYEPDLSETSSNDSIDTKEALEALGYLE